MPKYENTVIYIIKCKDETITDSYVGHTTNFSNRCKQHIEVLDHIKSHKLQYPLYKFIRENGGWDNWEIIEIEKWPCETREDAIAREAHWYNPIVHTLNKQDPGCTGRQAVTKRYNQTHDAIRKEKFECPCGGRYTYTGKSSHLKMKIHLKYIESLNA